MATDKRSKNELIKEKSHLLRGTIAEGLADVATGAISEDDAQLTKFHGTYMQDDRDLRRERAKKKLEKAYSFMIRLRLPGGVTTPKQWLQLDAIAGTYANHTLRLTTRQTFQFHGVIKSNMKRTMQAINAALLDTLAACGDVNRNVMAAANPYLSKAHAAAHELAVKVSEHLLPQTGAYHEIWLDGNLVVDKSGAAKKEQEPIYGTHYLPRKFKSRDRRAAVQRRRHLRARPRLHRHRREGQGRRLQRDRRRRHGHDARRDGHLPAHGRPARLLHAGSRPSTWRRRSSRCSATGATASSRKRARLKYTIEDRGLDAFRAEVERRLGLQARQAASLQVRVHRRQDRLGAGPRQEVAPDHVHRERPHQGYARACSAHGAARDRGVPHRRLRADRQPEPHHRQRHREGEAEDRDGPEAARRHAVRVLGAAPQQHGLRRAADLRPRARRERALPARPHHRARGPDSRRRGSRTTTSSSA